MRLDLHLTKKYPQYSRAHLQKLIKSRAVLVNKKIVTPHYNLKPSDKITEKITPPEKIDLSPDKLIKLNIIFEDKNYLVINKPSGLVVHPSESVKSHTLVNALIAHYPPIKTVGDHNPNSEIRILNSEFRPPTSDLRRPGIVHRLDKDVSGLMVIPKTQSAFNNLKQQFKNHKIKKQYTALVKGNLKKDTGQITLEIGRSSKGYKMLAYPPKLPGRTGERRGTKTPKQAITKYKIIKRFNNHTLLKIQTLTGRTHQIRVHLHAINHPIVGDSIYRTKKIKSKISFERVFLHADYLEFKNLENKTKKFKLELPKKLKNILNKLSAKG